MLKVRGKLRGGVQRALGGLEDHVVLAHTKFEHAPALIVGPPRSGTTVVYQALVDRYGFPYFPNALTRWPRTPALAWRRLGTAVDEAPGSDFSSDFGVTQGAQGPSEFGDLWYRWFPREPAHVTERLSPASSRLLRGTLACIAARSRGSLLMKNTYCALRVRPLVDALPELAWIRVRRDPVYVAQSLLEARRARGDERRWFSLRPPGLEQVDDLHPAEQVAMQVAGIERLLDEDLATSTPQCCVEIQYERFCTDPAAVLDEAMEQLSAAGVSGAHPPRQLPASFPAKDVQRLPDEDFSRIVDTLART